MVKCHPIITNLYLNFEKFIQILNGYFFGNIYHLNKYNIKRTSFINLSNSSNIIQIVIIISMKIELYF